MSEEMIDKIVTEAENLSEAVLELRELEMRLK